MRIHHMFNGTDSNCNVVAKCGQKAIGRSTLLESWETDPEDITCVACKMEMGLLPRPGVKPGDGKGEG